MLGNVNLQPPGQPSNHAQQAQQQQHQQQQQQQQVQNQSISAPPPPPLNGQDLNLSNILHYLQSEWRRYERDRNEWEIERAEMRARIALLEGERRSFENTRIDLLRRVKMLEFALRMERAKQLNQASGAQNALSTKSGNAHSQKEDSGSHKEGSDGTSPRSEDVPLPPENRISMASISGLPNGITGGGSSSKPHGWPSSNWSVPNNAINALAKPPPGRDPKSRARSREYLKQCLQEISYLTSAQAMNPLPNRPLLTNPTLPLALPNVPNFDQMAYNGRPRKIVPEVGKDFPAMNGVPMVSGTSSIPQMGGQPVTLVDRDTRMSNGPSSGSTAPHASQQQSTGQQTQFAQQQVNLSHAQPLQVQTQQQDKETNSAEAQPEPQQLTSIFRPDDDWKEQLARARADKQSQQQSSGASAWDIGIKDEDDDVKEEEAVMDEEEPSSTSEDDGKLWRTRRTLRNHLDAVRALAFHPNEMCLATGSDDCTIKVWRIDAVGLASSGFRSATDIEPQLTLRGHTSPITSLVHSPSKRLLYSASIDSCIRVWSLPPPSHTTYAPHNGSRLVGELVGHTDAIWGLALVRDETVLLSCGAEGLVKVWDVGSSSGPGSLKLSWGYDGLDNDEPSSLDEPPSATALEPIKSDLKKIAVAYDNVTLAIFDVDSGKLLMRLTCDSNPDGQAAQRINSLSSHPTTSMLCTAHEDKHIRIWDIDLGQCSHTILAHLDAVTSLSIDPAGFCLVSGSHDCSVRFWDLLGSRSCIQELTSHREKGHEGVLAVEFHPTMPFMASAGADGVVKLYASS